MTNDPSQPALTVYSFMTYEDDVEDGALAPFKSTREFICSRFNGQVLEGTGQKVEASELDGEGRLVRIATGWGALI